MGRVALGRTGWSGHNSLVAVFVRELRDGFGLRLAATGAGEGLYTGLGFRRLLRHFAFIPCVAERVRVSVHIAVAAGAGVRGITHFGAGRRGHNSVIVVLVRELRDGLRLRLAAAGAGEGLHTGLGFRRLLRHFAVVPCVTERVGVSIHIAVAAGAGVGRIALLGARRRCDNILVAVGMGNIIVMDVGGQKVIISIEINTDRFPLRLAPGIVHIGQRCAITESPNTNARHAVRDRHAGQRSAIMESIPANACHAIRDRHARQRCAAIESVTDNACHAVRDRITSGKSARALHQSSLIFVEQNTGRIVGVMTVALSDPYTGQRCTRSESGIANARHAVRDRHACKRFAFRESPLSNACHAVRDRHAGQRFAIRESIIANARHAVRDRHAGQRSAIIESILTNACHAVRDRHAGQRCAIQESLPSNARHAFCNHS